MALLTVKQLSFTYATEKESALRDISFSVEEGEFIVLAGATGSGKSTLLRLLKRELSPMGERTGEILLDGNELSSLAPREAAAAVGYVMQHPEEQIVTDRVYHELAFGLESLGASGEVIRRRVAEMASYFGIEEWFLRDTASLSGGQKQLLSLASVMVMRPRLLLLDEPTAQLDPLTASEFISTVRKLNRELGITVIMIEHRLEEVIPLCERMMVMEHGGLFLMDTPRRALSLMRDKPALLRGMPAAVRLFHMTGGKGECPLTVREGRDYLENQFENKIRKIEEAAPVSEKKGALSFSHVHFRYEKKGEDVLSDLHFEVKEGEIFAILGGNGSGKSTTLGVLAGLLTPYGGAVRVFDKKIKEYKNGSLYKECLTLLPQDVQTVFLCNTVREELAEAGVVLHDLPFELSHLLERHPYDTSGGERQLIALAKVLATKPRLLLLDEPTKGLDAEAKAKVGEVLSALKARGVTVVLVTHDVEFASSVSDRVALFFRGSIICTDTPRVFFSENTFYTTAVSRMTRGFFDNAVTAEDAALLCGRNGRRI